MSNFKMASLIPSPEVCGGWSLSEKKESLLHTLDLLKIKSPIKPYDSELLLDHDAHGVYCKNLVLKDRKGQFYLVIIPINQKIDLKKLKVTVGASRNVSFACESDVIRILGCNYGSVCPFGVMFNHEPSNLRIIIDESLAESSSKLYFHPFIGSEALAISYLDLEIFVNANNHCVEVLHLSEICEFDDRFFSGPSSNAVSSNLWQSQISEYFNDLMDSLHLESVNLDVRDLPCSIM